MTDTTLAEEHFSLRLIPAMRTNVAPPSDLPRAAAGQARSTLLSAVFAVLTATGLLLRESAQGVGPTGMVVTSFGILIFAAAGTIVTAKRLVRRADRLAAENTRLDRPWLWPQSTYLGPFDTEHGIRGAHVLHDLHQRARVPAKVSLRVQPGTIEVVSKALWAASHGQGLGIPISDLSAVDIVAGATPRSWLTAIRHQEGWRRGQVRFVTKDGRRADFTGVRVDHLAQRLEAAGGQRLSGGWS